MEYDACMRGIREAEDAWRRDRLVTAAVRTVAFHQSRLQHLADATAVEERVRPGEREGVARARGRCDFCGIRVDADEWPAVRIDCGSADPPAACPLCAAVCQALDPSSRLEAMQHIMPWLDRWYDQAIWE